MASHGHDYTSVLSTTPRELPGGLKAGSIALIVIGLVAAAFGLFGMEGGGQRVAATFVINFMYWGGIAQGALMFAVVFVLVKGRWGRPLKRLAEAMGLMMIPLYLLLIVFFLAGGLDIYEWSHWTHDEAPAHKAIYLTPAFFIARQVIGLGILIALNLVFIRASLRADLGVAKATVGSKAPAFWDRLIGDWKGDVAEIEASQRKQATLGPVLTIAYALIFSMLAVDMSMSLAPHWYANMFPAWYFMSCFWSGLVFLGIVSLVAGRWMGAEKLFKPSMYHDLGKLTFGLTMFWGYTTFAQYLPIWYGNMTEEIGYILLRTELEPWAGVSKVVFVLCFAVPWTMLLSRGLKKIPAAYLTVAGVLAIGIWLERFTVIMPSVWKGEDLPLGIPEIGMTLGFLGLFLLVVFSFLSKVPTVTFTDPYMNPDPDHVHVVPRRQAHHHGH